MELQEKKKQFQIQLINYFNNSNGQNTVDSTNRVKKFAENVKAIGLEFNEEFLLNAEKHPSDLMDLIAYSEMNILTRIKDIKNKLQGN